MAFQSDGPLQSETHEMSSAAKSVSDSQRRFDDCVNLNISGIADGIRQAPIVLAGFVGWFTAEGASDASVAAAGNCESDPLRSLVAENEECEIKEAPHPSCDEPSVGEAPMDSACDTAAVYLEEITVDCVLSVCFLQFADCIGA